MYPIFRGREKNYMSRRARKLGEGAKHKKGSVLSDLKFCTLSLANVMLSLERETMWISLNPMVTELIKSRTE